jgi:hypothetical protein
MLVHKDVLSLITKTRIRGLDASMLLLHSHSVIAPAVVLFNCWASHCFIAASYTRRHGLTVSIGSLYGHVLCIYLLGFGLATKGVSTDLILAIGLGSDGSPCFFFSKVKMKTAATSQMAATHRKPAGNTSPASGYFGERRNSDSGTLRTWLGYVLASKKHDRWWRH